MTGTILVQLVLALVAFASAYALFAEKSPQQQKEAPPTRKRPEEEYVTREEFEDELEKHRKALEWEWTEMYEKFEKLHLRLAKREKREQQQQQLPFGGEQREQDTTVSIFNLRKQGSI